MAAKACLVGHKGCSCRLTCCTIAPDRAAQIAQDARSGANWAQREAADPRSPSGSYGPGCICGAGGRTNYAALALKGVHGKPSGMCAKHPGGSVWASQPEVWKEVRSPSGTAQANPPEDVQR